MSLISLSSHHHLHRSHNAMSMHRSQVVSRQIPAPAHQHLPYFDHGTRITVRDLFGNMPVRVKQRALALEKYGSNTKDWEDLKRSLVVLALAWPMLVSLTVREHGTNNKMIIRSPEVDAAKMGIVSKVCSVLLQASLITSQDRSSFVAVKASTPNLMVRGSISVVPCATKQSQFLAFGVQPLISPDNQSLVHGEINRLFQNSAFGNLEESEIAIDADATKRATGHGDGFTKKELKGRKGVDRWPMYYINIEPRGPLKTSTSLDADDILGDKENSLQDVIGLLQAMILEFLTKNHFRPNFLEDNGSLSQNQIKGMQNPFDQASGKVSKSEAREMSTPKINHEGRSSMPHFSIANLGTNVKLPSFRRPPSISESPFDAWSRVKAGTVHSNLNTIQESEQSSSSPFQRPTTAHLPQRKVSRYNPPSSTPTSKSSKSSLPLVSSSGKIIRRPFEEVHISRPKPRPSTQQRLLGSGGSTGEHDDNCIAWINPVTKVKSYVNQRTGLTLPATKSTSTGRSPATGNPNLSVRKKLKTTIDASNEEPSPWIDSLLRNWDNPIFKQTEAAIPQVPIDSLEADSQNLLHGHKHNCSQLDIDKAFKETSSGINGRISKEALQNAEVISQLDKKFILVKLLCSNGLPEGKPAHETLVIIDQHAADERIRIEVLMAELCTVPTSPSESSIITTTLEKPLAYDISTKETGLLRTHQRHFSNWGILYNLPPQHTPARNKETHRLTIHSLPPGIVERCKFNPRLLIDLLRTEVWRVDSLPSFPASTNPTLPHPPPSPPHPTITQPNAWLTRLNTCPPALLDMLNSRACRSAIMFNDELSRAQCEILVRRLAGCLFPFQCAHGRPSLVPLVELGSVGGGRIGGEDGGKEGFGVAMRRWKGLREASG